MFKIFKEKTLRKFVDEANCYLKQVYQPKPPAVMVRTPEELQKEEPSSEKKSIAKESTNHIRYSLSPTVDDIKFSLKRQLKDNYEPEAVYFFMQKIETEKNGKSAYKEIDWIIDLSFGEKLREHIIEKGFSEPQVYRKAQIDRRVFSKILAGNNKPARDTAIALALALNLDLNDTKDFLSRAGYALSHSSKKDVIIEYFIRERHYNLFDINEVLHRLDQPVIGR